MDDGSSSAGNDGKGKGKEKDQESVGVASGVDSRVQDGSKVNRIVDSAIRLTRDMLTGPPSGSDLGRQLDSSKGQASTETSRTDRVGESSVRLHASTSSPQAFGSSHSQAHIAAEEAAFSDFLNGTDVQTTLPIEGGIPWSSSADVPEHVDSSYGSASFSPQPSRSVADQQRRDGDAVVALLSQPDTLTSDEFEDDALPLEARESLRRALFDVSAPAARDWDVLLNFMPEYLGGGEQSRRLGNTSSEMSRAMESMLHFGVSDPEEAKKLWTEQWSDVLNRYTDEVWGDLGPLIKQARAEIEQIDETKAEDVPPDTPALRRLRAILGHLRGGTAI
jgi:hypothetical protein